MVTYCIDVPPGLGGLSTRAALGEGGRTKVLRMDSRWISVSNRYSEQQNFWSPGRKPDIQLTSILGVYAIAPFCNLRGTLRQARVGRLVGAF